MKKSRETEGEKGGKSWWTLQHCNQTCCVAEITVNVAWTVKRFLLFLLVFFLLSFLLSASKLFAPSLVERFASSVTTLFFFFPLLSFPVRSFLYLHFNIKKTVCSMLWLKSCKTIFVPGRKEKKESKKASSFCWCKKVTQLVCQFVVDGEKTRQKKREREKNAKICCWWNTSAINASSNTLLDRNKTTKSVAPWRKKRENKFEKKAGIKTLQNNVREIKSEGFDWESQLNEFSI